MAVKFSPIGNGTNWIPGSGLIANGYKLYFYAAGTTTKQNTYTTYTGGTLNSNPITLNAYGRSTTEIWLTEGLSYKVVIASGSDTDPPASGVTLGDYITGINDTGEIGLDQWNSYPLAPTYISGTSFSVTGDQTPLFHIGRRVKTTNTGGTIYSTITNSVYGAATTITVTNDSGTLDAGLSAVSYGVLTSIYPSVPKIALPNGSSATTQSQGNNSTSVATTAYVDRVAHASIQDFRLTLTTLTPVTTGDVTGATTIYMTPYKGNKIGLYNGTSWDLITTSEISLAIGTLTADIGYDVFCYNNAGTATLEFTAWTSATARATALVMQDGILCKTGALTRRYIGSFYTTTTTTTTDSVEKRYLFNYYNRARKSLYKSDSTATWNYTTATWRQARAAATNQVDLFIGVLDQPVEVTVIGACQNGTGATGQSTGLGLNSTSAPTGLTASQSANSTTYPTSMTAKNTVYPILGKNYLAWLEYSVATGTSAWYGTSGGTISGISGKIEC